MGISIKNKQGITPAATVILLLYTIQVLPGFATDAQQY